MAEPNDGLQRWLRARTSWWNVLWMWLGFIVTGAAVLFFADWLERN